MDFFICIFVFKTTPQTPCSDANINHLADAHNSTYRYRNHILSIASHIHGMAIASGHPIGFDSYRRQLDLVVLGVFSSSSAWSIGDTMTEWLQGRHSKHSLFYLYTQSILSLDPAWQYVLQALSAVPTWSCISASSSLIITLRPVLANTVTTMSKDQPVKGHRSPRVLWKWEIAALMGSLACLAGIVIVLAVCNGNELFSWHRVTLNAVVSVLSTASKALLLFALGESIGQWKWLAFSKESRPLIDLDRVDSASRGPLGGAKWLWTSRWKQM